MEPNQQKSTFSRRNFLVSSTLGVGAISGCLRFQRNQNSEGTETLNSTPQSTPRDESQTQTPRDESQTQTPTPEPEFPELELQRVNGVTTGGRSSPGTHISKIDQKMFATVGGREASIYTFDPLSKVQSAAIPDVINFEHHGVTTYDGEAYIMVGGSTPTQIIRISPSEGKVWQFKEDHFGANVLRNVKSPCVTDDYVIALITTTKDREGNNNSVWFILDRSSGKLVKKPDMGVFADDTCSATGIAEADDVVMIGGCSKTYFYDLSKMRYIGSRTGVGSEVPRGRDGLIYSGSSAINPNTQSVVWANNTAPANHDLLVRENHIYSLYNDTINKIDRAKGSHIWKVNLSDYHPHYLGTMNGQVWVSTVDTYNDRGRIFLLESGSISGSYDHNPDKYQYDILHHSGHIFVGSESGIIKYKVQ